MGVLQIGMRAEGFTTRQTIGPTPRKIFRKTGTDMLFLVLFLHTVFVG